MSKIIQITEFHITQESMAREANYKVHTKQTKCDFNLKYELKCDFNKKFALKCELKAQF